MERTKIRTKACSQSLGRTSNGVSQLHGFRFLKETTMAIGTGVCGRGGTGYKDVGKMGSVESSRW